MAEIKWSHTFTNEQWQAIAGALMLVEVTLRPMGDASDVIGKKLAMTHISNLMNDNPNGLEEIISVISLEGVDRTKESIG